MARTAAFCTALLLSLSASLALTPAQKQVLNNLSTRQAPCAVNDICFAIDGSGSISSAGFKQEKNFVKLIVDQIASTASGDTQYSAVVFANRARVIQSGTLDVTDLSNSLDSFAQPGGSTAMGKGLNLCNNLLRRTTNRVIVLVTDGLDNGSPPAQNVGTTLKEDKVIIITVGVDNGIDVDFLKQLASVPEYFVSSKKFKTLPKKVVDVAIRSCAESPVRPPLDNNCGNKCRFRLCPNNGVGLPVAPSGRRVLMRAAKTALPPYICCPGKGCPATLGRVRSTGEAIVSDGGSAVDVSKYNPPVPGVLRKSFSKSYFGLYPIDFNPSRQGIGRLLSKANQEEFLDGLCVVLPITSYEVLKSNGKVQKIVTTSNEKDCVSFIASTADIIVELQWDSSDDFDLVVKEPSGVLLSRFNDKTESGRLNNDLNVASCDVTPSGKENAFYRGDKIEKGRYVVTVKQFVNCGNGATKWKVRVVRSGKVIATTNGTSNMDGGTDVGSVTFRIK